ncbi:hypothetical protein PR048_032759 [Dryococelus australis]|uniref:Uncharacterized protein n=1 Tax=Dryococelus australis TaxID=614101 RepID=A0ABQ9G498_9NEOP|nr:hypothetical protein PR048_032759 [Dryococelus australis]
MTRRLPPDERKTLHTRPYVKHSHNVNTERCRPFTVNTLTSNQGDPGSIPGRVTGFSQVGNRAGRCRWSAGFLVFRPPLHSGAAPYSLQSPSSAALKTSPLRAAQISSLTLKMSAAVADHVMKFSLNDRAYGGKRGKREIPEKTHRPATSSSKIPTCGNTIMTRPKIESASSLTAQPPRPHLKRGHLLKDLYNIFRVINFQSCVCTIKDSLRSKTLELGSAFVIGWFRLPHFCRRPPTNHGHSVSELPRSDWPSQAFIGELSSNLFAGRRRHFAGACVRSSKCTRAFLLCILTRSVVEQFLRCEFHADRLHRGRRRGSREEGGGLLSPVLTTGIEPTTSQMQLRHATVQPNTLVSAEPTNQQQWSRAGLKSRYQVTSPERSRARPSFASARVAILYVSRHRSAASTEQRSVQNPQWIPTSTHKWAASQNRQWNGPCVSLATALCERFPISRAPSWRVNYQAWSGGFLAVLNSMVRRADAGEAMHETTPERKELGEKRNTSEKTRRESSPVSPWREARALSTLPWCGCFNSVYSVFFDSVCLFAVRPQAVLGTLMGESRVANSSASRWRRPRRPPPLGPTLWCSEAGRGFQLCEIIYCDWSRDSLGMGLSCVSASAKHYLIGQATGWGPDRRIVPYRAAGKGPPFGRRVRLEFIAGNDLCKVATIADTCCPSMGRAAQMISSAGGWQLNKTCVFSRGFANQSGARLVTSSSLSQSENEYGDIKEVAATFCLLLLIYSVP